MSLPARWIHARLISFSDHSVKAASHAGRVLFIKDGIVFHQIYRGECSDSEMYQKIADTLTRITSGGGETVE